MDKYKVATEWKKFFNIITGINNVSDIQLSIYPNPTKDDLFIKSELPINKVEIYSMAGSLMMTENNITEKISLSALLKGIYVIKVYTDKGVIIRKIVKE